MVMLPTVVAVLIVERVWPYSVKTRVRSSLVVEIDVLPNRFLGPSHCTVGFKIDLFILDGTPEALYKDIVSPTPFAVRIVQTSGATS